MTADPSTQQPHRSTYGKERDWSKSAVPQHRCTAHRKNGEQCKNASLMGSTVCRYHGGAAKQCVRAARVRLQNAADKMARELLGMATDPNVSDSVKITAIRDALDRAGLKPVTAVDLEVSTKPWESVMEGISGLVSSPRAPAPAIEANRLEEYSDSYEFPGEIDPDEDELDAEVIDVEEDDQPGVITPDEDDSAGSVDLSGSFPGAGLMSLSDAVETQAYLRDREAARTRGMRRR